MGEGNNNKQRQSSEQFPGYLLHKFKKITDVKIVYIESTVHNLRKIELGIPCVVFR